MQPDNWEEWWRPACVLDMQPAMWSTRCRRACVRSHAEQHTGCHQPEADWLVSPINTQRPQLISSHPDLSKPISKHERKSAPREGSGQLKINQLKIHSDGKQVNVVREREKESVAESILHQGAKFCPIEEFLQLLCTSSAQINLSTLLILFDDQVEVLSKISSVPWFQFSRGYGSILCSDFRRIVQKLRKVLFKLSSVQTSIRGGSVQVKISPVQSSQGVPWVLAMSSPINQLLLA
ncbi:LOW QUALITY PROTEIN: hypothetical protein YC2023_089116 [Brassica napus]